MNPDEMKLCAHCERKTGFGLDEAGNWVSECCGWPPVPVGD
jgi:hypothetical protein